MSDRSFSKARQDRSLPEGYQFGDAAPWYLRGRTEPHTVGTFRAPPPTAFTRFLAWFWRAPAPPPAQDEHLFHDAYQARVARR